MINTSKLNDLQLTLNKICNDDIQLELIPPIDILEHESEYNCGTNGVNVNVAIKPKSEKWWTNNFDNFISAGTYSNGFIYFSGHGVNFSVDVRDIISSGGTSGDTFLRSDFNYHTGNTSIHFTLNDITLSNIGSSAHTHSNYLTGYTETDPVWISEKDNYSLTSHTHSNYLTGYTETDPVWISEKDNYSLTSHTHNQYVPYTGATSNVNLGTYNIKYSKLVNNVSGSTIFIDTNYDCTNIYDTSTGQTITISGNTNNISDYYKHQIRISCLSGCTLTFVNLYSTTDIELPTTIASNGVIELGFEYKQNVNKFYLIALTNII